MARRRAAPVRPSTQTRSASTAAYPARAPAAAHPPAPAPSAAHPPAVAQSQQPGLFAQMASTAAGVAVGSAVGHTIGAGLSSVFGGSSAPAEPAAAAPPAPLQAMSNTSNEGFKACDVDARNFTKCLDENSGNMQICDWYLQQLKSCQEMSRQY